jgi:hypothetical protein
VRFPHALLSHLTVREANGESDATASHVVINDWKELKITALEYPPGAETPQQES